MHEDHSKRSFQKLSHAYLQGGLKHYYVFALKERRESLGFQGFMSILNLWDRGVFISEGEGWPGRGQHRHDT
jgi:hypothetical protein